MFVKNLKRYRESDCFATSGSLIAPFFNFMSQGSFLTVRALCDQVVAKLVVESDTGKRNLEISEGFQKNALTRVGQGITV